MTLLLTSARGQSNNGLPSSPRIRSLGPSSTKGPKKIIGYWHFAALHDDQFQRAKNGELLDSEITLDTIEPIDAPGIYNLYFVLIGVLPDAPGGGTKLIDAFFDSLEKLAERGIFFREMCANAFTKDGKRVCEKFGMTLVGPHKDFGSVYHLSLTPWPSRLRYKRWNEIAQHYEQALNEEQQLELAMQKKNHAP